MGIREWLTKTSLPDQLDTKAGRSASTARIEAPPEAAEGTQSFLERVTYNTNMLDVSLTVGGHLVVTLACLSLLEAHKLSRGASSSTYWRCSPRSFTIQRPPYSIGPRNGPIR